MMVYLDNAATTQMSKAAIDAFDEIATSCFGNPSSLYRIGREARSILAKSREIIAECIGAKPHEIFFTSCGTESDNWVVKCVGNTVNTVITSDIEHHAVLFPVKELEASGKRIEIISSDAGGRISSASLVNSLNGNTSLVSIMSQNNETGVIQDICELAEIVHADNPKSVFHTDAVQTIGHRRFDVNALGVDFVSASAHKFNGPKGVGFLYVRDTCKIETLLLGGGQENGLRSGTENVAGVYSMARALEDNICNIDEISERIEGLESFFFDTLKENGICYRINGESKYRTKGVINISFDDVDAEGLLNMLDLREICVSVGSACNSKSKEKSHVLKAMGLDEKIIDSSIRISIGRYNTKEDIIELCKGIKQYCNAVNLAGR